MRDLGTYHVRVVFEDGDGFIMDYGTGGRFVGGGTDEVSPLTATWIGPIYSDEDDLASAVLYMFTDGNYSCDCNKRLFLARAHQKEEPETQCGDTLPIRSLVLIRPDGSERDLSEMLRDR